VLDATSNVQGEDVRSAVVPGNVKIEFSALYIVEVDFGDKNAFPA
jgi:hypothetical protein